MATSTAGPTGYRWREDPFLSWRVSVYTALVAMAAVAWWWTARQASGMDDMGGAGGMGGTAVVPTDLLVFLGTWVVMMAAMMFPSVAPMVATYVSVQRGRRRRSMPAAVGGTAFFVAGYLLAWAGVGLVCFAALRVGDAWAGEMFWMHNARWLTAAVLVGAAAFELTPAKHACLSRCRGPMAFVVGSWRDGSRGALRMGTVQGLWCVGCCWALMAALVALGLMSIGWMAVVSLLIAVEKLLPGRRLAVSVVTSTLVVLAVAVAVAPGHVPGLMV